MKLIDTWAVVIEYGSVQTFVVRFLAKPTTAEIVEAIGLSAIPEQRLLVAKVQHGDFKLEETLIVDNRNANNTRR